MPETFVAVFTTEDDDDEDKDEDNDNAEEILDDDRDDVTAEDNEEDNDMDEDFVGLGLELEPPPHAVRPAIKPQVAKKRSLYFIE